MQQAGKVGRERGGGGLTPHALKHTHLPILWFLLRQHELKSPSHTDKTASMKSDLLQIISLGGAIAGTVLVDWLPF